MSEIIIEDKLTVEERLEKLEKGQMHVHRHLESLLVLMERHDMRLLTLNRLMEHTGCSKDDVENFDNPKLDFEREDGCYTPINKEDKNRHEKYVKECKDELKELFGE